MPYPVQPDFMSTFHQPTQTAFVHRVMTRNDVPGGPQTQNLLDLGHGFNPLKSQKRVDIMRQHESRKAQSAVPRAPAHTEEDFTSSIKKADRKHRSFFQTR